MVEHLPPFFMEINKNDAMRSTMDKYGEAVHDIAKKYNTLFVDTQTAFDEILKYYYSAAIT
jgi:hypothetical protein